MLPSKLVPLPKNPLHPAATILNYGQGLFEGLKKPFDVPMGRLFYSDPNPMQNACGWEHNVSCCRQFPFRSLSKWPVPSYGPMPDGHRPYIKAPCICVPCCLEAVCRDVSYLATFTAEYFHDQHWSAIAARRGIGISALGQVQSNNIDYRLVAISLYQWSSSLWPSSIDKDDDGQRWYCRIIIAYWSAYLFLFSKIIIIYIRQARILLPPSTLV